MSVVKRKSVVLKRKEASAAMVRAEEPRALQWEKRKGERKQLIKQVEKVEKSGRKG